MTGPDHFQLAEHHLSQASELHQEDPAIHAVLARAQVHATLAQAAATIDAGKRIKSIDAAWNQVLA